MTIELLVTIKKKQTCFGCSVYLDTKYIEGQQIEIHNE